MNQFRRKASVVLAASLLVSLALAEPAGALSISASIRQVAGAIPNPHRDPKALAKVGSILYVVDGSGIARVDLVASSYEVVAGDRFEAGAADGTGTAARFDHPLGLATDGATLLVADTGNHAVRRVDLTTFEVTTLAGALDQPGSADGTGAAARFDGPTGVATNGTKAWVTDRDNVTIRAVTIATGVVTTIAGLADTPGTANGTGTAARFRRPSGISLEGGNLWLTDANRVRRLVIATTAVTLVAKDNPQRDLVGVTAHGNYLYLVNGGRVLRAHKTTGVVKNWLSASGSAFGIIDDNAGDLYLAGYTVFIIDIATKAVTEAGALGQEGSVDGTGIAARFSEPSGIATDGAGTVYVSDGNADSIRQVDAATGVVTTLATGLVNPEGSVVVGDTLYVANSFDELAAIDVDDGTVTPFVDGFSSDASGDPHDVASDGTDLFVAHADCAVYRVSLATAQVSVLAGSPGDCGYVDGPAATARFGTGSMGCGVCGPTSLTVADGTVYVADTYNGAVRTVDVATGTVATLFDTSDGLVRPYGITSAAGRLYVVDVLLEGLVRLNPDTGAVKVLGTAIGAEPLTYAPTAVADTSIAGVFALDADPDGHRLFLTTFTGVAVAEDP